MPLTFWAICLAASACSGEKTEAITAAEAAKKAAKPAPPTPKLQLRKDLFDKKGELKESNQKIVTLKLPVGLEHVRSAERVHIYRSRVRPERVVAYFRPRLFTPYVEPVGRGMIFRNAEIVGKPAHIRTNLEVAIREGGRGKFTSIEIRELPPPKVNQKPPSADDMKNYGRDMM